MQDLDIVWSCDGPIGRADAQRHNERAAVPFRRPAPMHGYQLF
jgi:hypothetical protein